MSRIRWILPILVVPLLVSCSSSSPILAGQTPGKMPESATPTPTAGPPLVGEITEAWEPPGGGTLEILIPFDIFSQGESPSGILTCSNSLPFRIAQEDERLMVQGQGRIDCHFEDTPQNSAISFHVVIAYDAVFSGELLPATISRLNPWLDSYLTLDGYLVQYYIGYPTEASNPCPQANPCPIPMADTIPLPFTFEDGATITTPWTFTLHLH
jgi:hypothetical protein